MNRTLVPVLGLLAACSSNISQEDADELVQAATPLMENGGAGTPQAYQDTAEVASAASTRFPLDDDGAYVGSVGTLSWSWMVDCFDGAGASVDCDDNTVRAEVGTTLDGSLVTPRYDLTLDRDADWVVDGLDSSVVTLDGTATTVVQSSFEALFRDVRRTWALDLAGDYALTGDATAASVTGTVEWDVLAERTRTEGAAEATSELDTTIEVTFLGDGTADVLVDGVYSYTVDLDSGDVTSL